jgi:predicted alpha/beta-fold hydrolase
MKDLEKVSSWRDWDEHYTKKVYPQYSSIADYYYAASALSKIQNISVPTLVVHSRDDPIVPFECMPVRECLSNPNIIVAAVEKGGHVCYFQGAGGQKRWYPRASAEFLDAVIEIKERKHRGEAESTNE